MSLNTSLVMIRSDHLQEVPRILAVFEHSIESEREVKDWDDALAAANMRPEVPGEEMPKVALLHNGWTVILDLEAVLWIDKAACTEVSRIFASPVFAMCCSGTGNLYAYRFFDGSRQRLVWGGAEGLFENEGDSLPEEEGLDLAELDDELVLTVMNRLGVDYDALEESDSFHIFTSKLSTMPTEPPPPPPSQSTTETARLAKPWWKFW